MKSGIKYTGFILLIVLSLSACGQQAGNKSKSQPTIAAMDTFEIKKSDERVEETVDSGSVQYTS